MYFNIYNGLFMSISWKYINYRFDNNWNVSNVDFTDYGMAFTSLDGENNNFYM